ncbi:hypothetical protein FHX57_006778 [Paraburkholderia tropica]|uniref:hypothetical protein n=1 Tax=Paraburkholderia tropica TaxID=92647 RepID=UPI00161F4AA8|nr:hypothetical protein [Paraburkholderia tropica]MBB3004396.1 hypothetical protein [Paraburkholderia tropica]
MNCKPGDLAYVVCGYQIGVVVTVEKAADPFWDGSPAWVATSREPLETVKRKSRARSMATRFRVRDSWLRPISGVPVNDEVDQGIKEPA